MNIKQIRLENFKNIKNSRIEFRSNLSGDVLVIKEIDRLGRNRK